MSAYRVVTLSGSDPALGPYINLIYASWMKSLRYGNPWFKDIDSQAFYRVYETLIESILVRPETAVRLALLNDDPDICIGWSVSEGKTLHYVYVKGDIQARRNGIGKSLVPEGIDTITHLTKDGRAIWKLKGKAIKFNPFQ